MEQPYINTYFNKERLADHIDNELIASIDHANSVKIDDNKFHIINDKYDNIYYSHNGKEFGAISAIKNNTQKLVSKRTGTVDDIHHFMNHHIMNSGNLMSDSNNTNGSKKLWTDFIKKNPQHQYSILNTKSGFNKNIDSKDIDALSDSIWNSKNLDYSNIRLKATRK